jgi:hypothetical protein
MISRALSHRQCVHLEMARLCWRLTAPKCPVVVAIPASSTIAWRYLVRSLPEILVGIEDSMLAFSGAPPDLEGTTRVASVHRS